MDTQTRRQAVLGPLPWPADALPPAAETLPALLAFQAELQPDAPALVAGDVRRSYRELSDRVEVAARLFVGLGVTAGTRVGILAPNVEEWIVATYGALRAGASVDAFNTWAKAYDLNHLLSVSGVEVLVMVPSVRSVDLMSEVLTLIPELVDGQPGSVGSKKFPELRHVVAIGSQWEHGPLPSAVESFDELMVQAESLPASTNVAGGDKTALVLYTSGTTSQPKAVPLAHRMLIENGFAIGSRMGLGPTDRVWLGSPLFWSYGCANAALAAFSSGACLVLQERFAAPEAAALIKEEQCTAAYLLPSLVSSLVEEVGEEIRAVESLRTGLIIGRPEEVRLAVEGLGIPELCNVYGSTEVYGNCCVTPHTMPLEQRIECQGPPLSGVTVRVADEQSGEVLGIGVPGEFQVRGRVMTGYLDDPENSAKAFTSDGWFKSGDTGIIRPDGTVQFVSRATDMIKTSGINVSPTEVESFIGQHPDVVEVGVVGAPHPSRGEATIAFVVVRPGSDVTAEKLWAFCKESLAGFKVPWAVELIESLPKTTTGKMMRRELREPAVRVVEARLKGESR